MNFGVNKPKIFDVQTTSFSEILLVILFFLLIFNIDGSQQVEGLKVEIKILNEKNDELTKENKELKKLILQKDEQIDKLEKEIAAWKQKFILVNKENVLLKSE